MSTPTFSFSSESNERYTPPEIIAAARAVMDTIELDAASCAKANEIVRAERFFTIQDDALKQFWYADTVWCNPPYGKVKNKSMAGIFLDKMIYEFRSGHFIEGIMLVNACPSAEWFRPAYQFPICFTNGRIAFLDCNLKPLTQPTKDNALIYFGQNPSRFVEVFDEHIGVVVTRLSAPINSLLRSEALNVKGKTSQL